ncbi:unnamed protein product [Adineta ricciae]|uniref:Uncharacterized protein n=1 Tax=Adineta ricciae TaxID=249248 RepID=A0A815U0R5_ADIRI|nr:unnamed protein product [Adineta ricciae]CAF1509413.1 unnamed protein product [Adineta ricciae]
MFKNDLSYLYSDDILSSTVQDSSMKVAKRCENEAVRIGINRRAMTINHRSKHLLIFGDDMFKRDRNRLISRKMKDKRHYSEKNLLKQICQLESGSSFIENQLRQLQLPKNTLEDVTNNNFSLKMTIDSGFDLSMKS